MSYVESPKVGAQGRTVYWSLGDNRFSRTKMRDGFDNLGIGSFTPHIRTDAAVLKAILVARSTRGETVLPLDQEHPDYGVGFDYAEQVDQGDGKVAPDHHYTAYVKGCIVRAFGDAGEMQHTSAVLTMDFMREKNAILPKSVGASLARIATDHLGGISLRPTGGFYWVPDKFLPDLKEIAAVIQDSVMSGTNAPKVYALETVMDEETADGVKDAIYNEIAARAEELKESAYKVKETGLETIRNEASKLHDKCQEYEAHLQQGLPAIHRVIANCQESITAATLKLSKIRAASPVLG